jgi:ribosomal protein S18 acetylase RimI-like enzyme
VHTEFRRVSVPEEIRSLVAFDRKVFTVHDRFPTDYWQCLESYWMLIQGVKVGCCAFQRNVDFQHDRRDDGVNPRMPGSLYIASTAILPRFQCRGFGRMLKCWQIAFANHEKFHRIVTNTRKRNEAMIHLNRKFGFRVIRTTADYYSHPAEPTIVMELRLDHR